MEERYLLYDSSEYQYLFGPCDMYMCVDSQYLSVWTNPEGGIATGYRVANILFKSINYINIGR